MLYMPPSGSTTPNASYVGANVPAGTDGSRVPKSAIEAPQRELVAVIAAGQQAGLDAPSATDLNQLLKAIRSGLLSRFVATGTADAIAIAPAIPYLALVEGMRFRVKIPGSGTSATTTPTFTVSQLAPVTIVKRDGSAPAIGDLVGGTTAWLEIDAAGKARVEGALPSDGTAGDIYFELAGPDSGTLPRPPGYAALDADLWGGGGSGGGSVGGGSSGSSGGGGGGWAFKHWAGLTSGLPYSLPGPVAGGAAGGNSGTVGGTATLGTMSATGGGPGSYGTNALGGAGGSGSGGDYNQSGMPGGPSVGTNTTGGSGGSAPRGGGVGSVGGMGVAGGLGGGGGGGAGSATASAGAAGGASLIRGRWKRS